MKYSLMKTEDLKEQVFELEKKYEEFKAMNLKLDMSRGKPCMEQLDLTNGMISCLKEDEYKTKDGIDCRNYGGVDGISEAKELFAQILDVSVKEIMLSGNSSLNLMYDMIARGMIHGTLDSDKPWSKYDKIKFLCPAPGYDRHFAICELFNIEMINIDMKNDGPDMDAIEKLVAEDDTIKGIWCVPKYSNPDGITYSDEVVDRFAKMYTKAKDFRIFWDNAYVVHHLKGEGDKLKNILTECKYHGNGNRVFIFSSTSKISFPGAGVSMLAASEDNINYIKKQISIQTIGPDKLNQLRHVKFFKNVENINEHMKKQAEIIGPKFDLVLNILDRELKELDIAWWNSPNGGYFISLNTLEGCAKEVEKLALSAGLTLTKIGATFPYGIDPKDRNIRIAPTFPPLHELEKAIELLCVCIKLVSAKKYLS